MERYPLLLLPTPSVTSPSLRPGGGDTIHAPPLLNKPNYFLLSSQDWKVL
ncbi:hypothetical protein L6G62_001185 [Acinetobacter baumannii]|nr:hypothetical protein [Acinetobacter baumannii]